MVYKKYESWLVDYLVSRVKIRRVSKRYVASITICGCDMYEEHLSNKTLAFTKLINKVSKSENVMNFICGEQFPIKHPTLCLM